MFGNGNEDYRYSAASEGWLAATPSTAPVRIRRRSLKLRGTYCRLTACAAAYRLQIRVLEGDLGDSPNASSDIKTAVDLDPSLARYVTIKGKTVSLALPPL